ncbi:MAG: RnfABCDGE type electron transport complex subunit G [Candidatus Margulisbacteria bacterium]|nr:RnfABCDGE type electron transport complex subunit G [Candidatus Margulisiibacteriota bacterium]
MGKIAKLAMILTVFCVIASGSLAFVYLFTQPKIETNAEKSFEMSLREVLPVAEIFKAAKCSEGEAYIGIKGDKTVGLAVSVAPRGYSGAIKMLVGINADGKVIGVKVLDQRETPGLGANVVKRSFLAQFCGKTVKDEIEPKKDIDAITGATISSRAVARGVKEALKTAKECK